MNAEQPRNGITLGQELRRDWPLYWSRHRNDLLELQHLVLARNTQQTREKVGVLLDRTRWLLDEKSERPVLDELIEELLKQERTIKRLRSRPTGYKMRQLREQAQTRLVIINAQRKAIRALRKICLYLIKKEQPKGKRGKNGTAAC